MVPCDSCGPVQALHFVALLPLAARVAAIEQRYFVGITRNRLWVFVAAAFTDQYHAVSIIQIFL